MITTSQTGFLTKNRHFLKRNEQIKAKLKLIYQLLLRLQEILLQYI